MKILLQGDKYRDGMIYEHHKWPFRGWIQWNRYGIRQGKTKEKCRCLLSISFCMHQARGMQMKALYAVERFFEAKQWMLLESIKIEILPEVPRTPFHGLSWLYVNLAEQRWSRIYTIGEPFVTLQRWNGFYLLKDSVLSLSPHDLPTKRCKKADPRHVLPWVQTLTFFQAVQRLYKLAGHPLILCRDLMAVQMLCVRGCLIRRWLMGSTLAPRPVLTCHEPSFSCENFTCTGLFPCTNRRKPLFSSESVLSRSHYSEDR